MQKLTMPAALLLAVLISSTVPAPAAAYSKAETDYVATLRLMDKSVATHRLPDFRLIKLGHRLCTGFDSGVTVQRFLHNFLARRPSRFAMKVVSAVLPAAIIYLCPRHLDQLKALH